jgi:hypothetical protein
MRSIATLLVPISSSFGGELGEGRCGVCGKEGGRAGPLLPPATAERGAKERGAKFASQPLPRARRQRPDPAKPPAAAAAAARAAHLEAQHRDLRAGGAGAEPLQQPRAAGTALVDVPGARKHAQPALLEAARPARRGAPRGRGGLRRRRRRPRARRAVAAERHDRGPGAARDRSDRVRVRAPRAPQLAAARVERPHAAVEPADPQRAARGRRGRDAGVEPRGAPQQLPQLAVLLEQPSPVADPHGAVRPRLEHLDAAPARRLVRARRGGAAVPTAAAAATAGGREPEAAAACAAGGGEAARAEAERDGARAAGDGSVVDRRLQLLAQLAQQLAGLPVWQGGGLG